MNNVRGSKRRRGFTLLEVMVATVILAVGLSMGLGAIASMTSLETRARETEHLNRLAVEKLHEVLAIGDVNNQQTEGTFDDYNEPDYKWTMEVAPSGTTNVDTVRITVEKSSAKSTDPSVEVTGLVFTSPNAQTGGLGG